MKEKIFHADYLCTWNLQAVACEEQGKVQEDGEISFIGDQGASTTREAITEHTVFGKNGWINLFPEDRQDLFFLLDDGWDVEYLKDYGKEMYKFGSHDVNEKKFPSFKGNWGEEFHTFGMDWQKDSLTWYIDGKPVLTSNPSEVCDGKYIFNEPMFVVLTCYSGRDVCTPLTGLPDETTDWENGSHIEIDYLKVWQY